VNTTPKTEFAQRGGMGETGAYGEKTFFYCDICEIELNSEQTAQSHVNGKKHIMMQKAKADREQEIR
jgi:hypothetical protein